MAIRRNLNFPLSASEFDGEPLKGPPTKAPDSPKKKRTNKGKDAKGKRVSYSKKTSKGKRKSNRYDEAEKKGMYPEPEKDLPKDAKSIMAPRGKAAKQTALGTGLTLPTKKIKFKKESASKQQRKRIPLVDRPARTRRSERIRKRTQRKKG